MADTTVTLKGGPRDGEEHVVPDRIKSLELPAFADGRMVCATYLREADTATWVSNRPVLVRF